VFVASLERADRKRLGLVGVALIVLTSTGAACRGGGAYPNASSRDVDIAGVDTHDFTPREMHEFLQDVSELASPCANVAVPIAECVTQQRPCPACLSAARTIAKAVRDGMTRQQVHDLYRQRFDVSSSRSIPVDGSPSRGPDAAPVVVVEFADFECPFCQKLAPELDRMWEARKEKVRFVYKFLPLSMHHHGEIAARAAIAAQMQGKFWEMHDQLFANGQHLEESDLIGYARAIAMNIERFRADMESDAAKARIDADRKLADALGIKGTPTLFIDGREYDLKVDIGEWVDGEIAAAVRQ
jgi:thiol-disulfide isomerase/thioredoxin